MTWGPFAPDRLEGDLLNPLPEARSSRSGGARAASGPSGTYIEPRAATASGTDVETLLFADGDRMIRIRASFAIAGFLLLTGPVGGLDSAGALAAEAESEREEMRRRIGELEKMIAALRTEIEKLRIGLEKGEGAAPSSSALMALERKVEALTLEVLRLKAEKIRYPTPVEPNNGFAPAA